MVPNFASAEGVNKKKVPETVDIIKPFESFFIMNMYAYWFSISNECYHL